LAKMLTPFRLGVGGRAGSGKQYWSWIAVDDAIGILHHALMANDVEGPINAVSPEPVTQRDFARTLGRVLRRPAIVPTPGFVLRAALGEMVDETLLSSTRVLPLRIKASGYAFQYPSLDGALRHLLGRMEHDAR
jgi:uncharacterized protein